jgi:hypothetical protein
MSKLLTLCSNCIWTNRNTLHKFYNIHCMCQAKFVTLFFVVTVLTLLHNLECTLWKGLKFYQNHLVILNEMIILSLNHHTLLNRVLCVCVCVIHTLVSCEVHFGQRNSWISYKWRLYVPSESCYHGWRNGSFQAHNTTQKPDGSTNIMEVHHMMDMLLICVCVCTFYIYVYKTQRETFFQIKGDINL